MAWILSAPSREKHRYPATCVSHFPFIRPSAIQHALIVLSGARPSNLRSKFRFITEAGHDLLSRLLTYDPDERISAEEALKHPYFKSVSCYVADSINA